MPELKSKSLGELQDIYKRKLQYWESQKVEHEKKIAECQREIAASEAKLRHIQALLGTPANANLASAKIASTKPRRRKKQRKPRRSPVREAALQALRDRAGQRLTTKELLKAIHTDTRKKVSRQAINVNVAVLENEGLIRRDPAPRGSGARYVYSAI